MKQVTINESKNVVHYFQEWDNEKEDKKFCGYLYLDKLRFKDRISQASELLIPFLLKRISIAEKGSSVSSTSDH